MGQFHGQHQIQDTTIIISKLVADFLNGSDWNITNGNNNATITGLSAPVNPNDAVTKTYVDAIKDSSLKQPEAYDPTVTGNYPLTYAGNAIEAGDTFRITNAQAGIGDGNRDVNGEDLLIALVDTPSATLSTDWMVAESNRTQATESTLGLLELATQVETDAGTDNLRAITPLKLATYISNLHINKTAGAGILETNGVFDIQSADNTMTINADSIQVNIGSTNGISLENSATGLELVANVTGNRTFSGGAFTLDTGANAIGLNDVAQTGAISIGNASAGTIQLSSSAASSFTSTVSITIDAPADNALLVNQPTGGTALAIATTQYVDSAIGGAREYNKTMTVVTGGAGVGTATLDVAPTTGFTKSLVLLNGQSLLLGTDYTVTNATTGEITAAGDTVFTGSSVVWSHYTDA